MPGCTRGFSWFLPLTSRPAKASSPGGRFSSAVAPCAAGIRRNLWDAGGGYYNDVFIDITDVVEKKLAAMDCLVSQGYGGAYARKRIETSDGAFGQAGGVAYGEGFIALNSETHYFLPVTDYALKRARSSDYEIMARYSYRIKTD